MIQSGSRINPDVQLEPEAISLFGGLDFTTNKLQVDKGTLQDCLNYEVVDKLGYQEVAGFTRFDGRISPDQLEFFCFKVQRPSFIPSVGEQFTINGTKIGVCVDSISTDAGAQTLVVYARIDSDLVAEVGDTIVPVTSSSGSPAAVVSVGTFPLSEYTTNLTSQDAEGLYARLETYNAVLRGRITDLHDTPIGLHWYRDKEYAVVDEVRLGFNSGGTTEIMPNQIVWIAGTYAARVLNVTLASGTWAGGDASGTMLIEPLAFSYFGLPVYSGNTTVPTSGNFDLIDNVADQNTITANVFTARALTSADAPAEYATLWRSKDESDLTSNEAILGFGWERIAPGWEVDFIEGFSETGRFRKIERSINNNFTFTEGDEEGLPVGFEHGGVITNLIPNSVGAFSSAIGLISDGAQGWRDSTAPAAFVENTDSIAAADTDYIFGDVWGRLEGSSSNPIPYVYARGEDGVYDTGTTGFDPSVPVITNPRIANARSPLIFYNFGDLLAGIDGDAVITGIEITASHDIAIQYEGGVPDSFTGGTDDFLVPNIGGAVKLYAALLEYDADTGSYNYRGGLRSSPVGISVDPADWSTSTGSASGGRYPVEGTFTDTGLTTVVGGEGNTFSLDEITLEDLESGKYSVAVFGKVDTVTTTGATGDWTNSATGYDVDFTARFEIDQLQIKVYYTEPSARYYITDDASSPTQILQADLVSYVTATGSLSNRTGAGKMQFTNIVTHTGTKTTILKGDTIHPSPTITPTTALAKVNDNAGTETGDVGMVLNGLPTKQDLIDASSRYQFITANFYARDDWDGFYGVSGAGKAFSFGEFEPQEGEGLQQYLTKITTNTITDVDDKPRHLAFHAYMLALGFRDGMVRFSVPGEPENYSGVDGAVEIGVGDKVVGLLSLVGNTLAVYCENSIHSIVGSDSSTLQAQVLVPESGAIEYTAVNVGGTPIHCDPFGITTLAQSQKYGNFVGMKLSSKVSPWIIPRMTRDLDLFSLNNAAGVVCAVPVRAKNQYRLFFRDGRVLVLTLNSDDTVAFTFSKYYLGGDQDGYFVPFAHSSQIDENGRERIHMSHYSPHSAATSNYVYEFERGFGFDNEWFDAYFTTNWYFRNPFQFSTINKVRADGLSRGLGYGRITVGKDYDEGSYSIGDQDISLPPNPSSTMLTDFKPTTAMANVAKQGRSLSLKIFRDENETTLHPPVCYQVLLVQYQQGGRTDA